MENKNNYIVVAYKLYADIDGERQLIEETPEGQPFWFISGMGLTLPQFDSELGDLHTGDTFDFVIAKDDAYGDYEEERVADLDKSIFMPDGKLDEKIIHVGAIIPLMNADGNRFNGQILEIGEKTVKVDLNHPYAGLDLNFTGTVLESRPATLQEMERVAKFISGEGCGGCGGSCGDGDCGSCGDGDCGSCGDGGCGGCNN